jgi:hypothetical protein
MSAIPIRKTGPLPLRPPQLFQPLRAPAGTDTGEAVEIAGPAGTDLSGWNVALYNGNGSVAEDFTWAAPQAATFGAVNTGQTFRSTKRGCCPASSHVNELDFRLCIARTI